MLVEQKVQESTVFLVLQVKQLYCLFFTHEMQEIAPGLALLRLHTAVRRVRIDTAMVVCRSGRRRRCGATSVTLLAMAGAGAGVTGASRFWMLGCRLATSVATSATIVCFRFALLAKGTTRLVAARAAVVGFFAFRLVFFFFFNHNGRLGLFVGTSTSPTRRSEFGIAHGLLAAALSTTTAATTRGSVLFGALDIFPRHGALHVRASVRLAVAVAATAAGLGAVAAYISAIVRAAAPTVVRIQIAGTLAGTTPANTRNNRVTVQCGGAQILPSTRSLFHVVGGPMIASGSTVTLLTRR